MRPLSLISLITAKNRRNRRGEKEKLVHKSQGEGAKRGSSKDVYWQEGEETMEGEGEEKREGEGERERRGVKYLFWKDACLRQCLQISWHP